MNIKELKTIIKDCKDESEVIIFALTEGNLYRPFQNITAKVYDKDSFRESLHLDISIDTEYKSLHFPDNPSKDSVEDLLDKKMMLLEELEDINNELKGFK